MQEASSNRGSSTFQDRESKGDRGLYGDEAVAVAVAVNLAGRFTDPNPGPDLTLTLVSRAPRAQDLPMHPSMASCRAAVT